MELDLYCCFYYGLVTAPGILGQDDSVTVHGAMTQGKAMSCHGWLLQLIQLIWQSCSLTLVSMEWLACPIYIFPHSQRMFYMSMSSFSEMKERANFPQWDAYCLDIMLGSNFILPPLPLPQTWVTIFLALCLYNLTTSSLYSIRPWRCGQHAPLKDCYSSIRI